MADANGQAPAPRGLTLRARGWVGGVQLSRNHLGEGDVLLTREGMEFASGSPFRLLIPYVDVEAIRAWDLLEPALEEHSKVLANVDYSVEWSPGRQVTITESKGGSPSL